MEPGVGVLAHITSLPDRTNPGEPGTMHSALSFIDWLHDAGVSYWQILPINPTDQWGSPYAGLSAFAGNTALMPSHNSEALRLFEKNVKSGCRFVRENAHWLEPYACFTAIKELLGDGSPWWEWPEKYRRFTPALPHARELATGVKRECERQFMFMQQWEALLEYAHERGVKIIGDMPMYVSADSSDVWANPEMFCLNEDGYPAQQAGTPPDSFAVDGQLWGNPTYDWARMRADGYDWWLRRLERSFELYDYVRLDHFLGFSSYYTVPEGKGAKDGSWNFAPGLELFQRAYEKFGPLPVVAEDLGTVTPAVRALVSATGFAGMDVVQFFDGDVREGYTPAPGKLVYTSTHDTQTLLGWTRERFGLRASDDDTLARATQQATEIMESCLAAPADVVMVPLQDVLLLGDTARMNVPGVAAGNWTWQADHEDVVASVDFLRELAEKSERSR
jgi:4-alpha-glucanotransferase